MRNSYLGFMLVVLLSVACGDAPNHDEEANANQPKRDANNVMEVEVVSAVNEPLSIPIKASAKLEAGTHQELSFQVGGRLSEIHIKNGQRIQSGQLIAKLYNQEQNIQYQEAELAYKQALYKDEDERMFLNDSSFYKDKWSEVDEKTALKSGLLQAKLALRTAEMSLRMTLLKAPFSGVITDLSVAAGDYINPSESVAKLYDPRDLELLVNLLEYDFPKIGIGQQVQVVALANPQKTYQGKISEINPVIDATGHFEVRIALTGNTSGLVPGMSASVSIASLKEEPSVIVPIKAVVNRSGKSVVFTHKEGLAKWNYVTLGDQNGEFIEVLDGVAAGSQVIITDVFQLAHDSPVVIAPSKESSTAGL